MAPPADDDVSAGSILRELIFNQYQAIVLGGAAVMSVVALNPMPLLIWLGSELVLLPILDSGPLRRLVNKRKRDLARARAGQARAGAIAELSAPHAKRYAAMEALCRQIETNYQHLSGISQAYLAEQRAKLDMVLTGGLMRLTALQRYQKMPPHRTEGDIEREIAALEAELASGEVAERAAAALTRNLELKRRLLASVGHVDDSVRALQTEIDSMESLLEVLHQNSLSLRDPQAISEELDTIVRQSEDSDRIVREMEALLRTDTDGWQGTASVATAAVPPVPTTPDAPAGTQKQKVRDPAAGERKGVLASIRQTGVLRVGMEPDAPPMRFINARKQDDGFDFRLAGLVADGIGARRVQVVEADYEELPARLAAGDIDIIMGGYVPDPSIDGVVWSNGYLDFGLCLIVAEGMAGTYRSSRDLAGKRIAIYDDPAAERWVQQNIPGARISKFSGDDGWFEAVERDQADALIYDYPFAAEEIKAHPRTTIVQYNLNQSKYAVGIPAGNFDLAYEVNQVIDRVRATPQYADLMREYLTTVSDIFTRPVEGRKSYTVKAGDTLSKIAQAQLGDSNRWRDIWTLNTSRVANENLIYPRLVLLMP